MSIFFNYHASPNRRFRRAIEDDVDDIQIFITDEDKRMFGDVDIGRLMYVTVLFFILFIDF